MSAILKFDFQKRKQLRFSEVNDLNYKKKNPILHVTTTFSLKQEETRTNSVPIPHPLKLVFFLFCVVVSFTSHYLATFGYCIWNTLCKPWAPWALRVQL